MPLRKGGDLAVLFCLFLCLNPRIRLHDRDPSFRGQELPRGRSEYLLGTGVLTGRESAGSCPCFRSSIGPLPASARRRDVNVTLLWDKCQPHTHTHTCFCDEVMWPTLFIAPDTPAPPCLWKYTPVCPAGPNPHPPCWSNPITEPVLPGQRLVYRRACDLLLDVGK